MTEKQEKSKFALPYFVDWFPYVVPLTPLLLLEWKIIDQAYHPTAVPFATGSKHLLATLAIPLSILIITWIEYQIIKSDLIKLSNGPFVLRRIRKGLLSILYVTFFALLFLLDFH